MKSIVSGRLKLLREKKDATQKEVAFATGINAKTLSGYENGVSKTDIRVLLLLATYYNVTIDYLVGRTDDPTPPINTGGKHSRENLLAQFDEEGQKMLLDYLEFLESRKNSR